jgi:hypothetical protein
MEPEASTCILLPGVKNHTRWGARYVIGPRVSGVCQRVHAVGENRQVRPGAQYFLADGTDLVDGGRSCGIRPKTFTWEFPSQGNEVGARLYFFLRAFRARPIAIARLINSFLACALTARSFADLFGFSTSIAGNLAMGLNMPPTT